ncbi:hypothetical protein M3Y97_00200100 [Aphelenchoides bicaudatus]|nr:hypothetical protein M3Y97_00200100 [Aphelenchoides bicaudatus]
MCPTGVEPQRNADGNIMWCRHDAECRNNYECIPIVGLMHFGNVVKYCCPTKSSYCTKKPHLPLDLSACTKPAITLYYFDVKRRKCRPYMVASCNKIDTMVDEVENRFGSLKDCRARCESTACDVGESPLYLDEELTQPYLCESSEHCPHAYVCRLDRLFHRQVCCGKTQFDPCPNHRTFIIPFTGTPKTCNLNGQKDQCPNDYVCMSSSENLFAYCCANIRGVCPISQKPYIHPLTGNAIKCNIHSYAASSCPEGYSVVTNCPAHTKPFINVATNLPQKCTVGVTTCSHGYQCLNSELNSRIGYCCSQPSSIEFAFQTIKPNIRYTTTQSSVSTSLETAEEVVESKGSEDRSERSLTTRLQSPIKTTETIIKKKILQAINILNCPEDFEPMTYPSTQLILHCTRGHGNDCPAPSKCLKAVDDVLERALCCIHRDDKLLLKANSGGSHELSSTKIKIVDDNVQLGESTDPSCPTIILQRSCVPGSVRMCKEENFFCQYNKQFEEYLCCSQFRSFNHHLMYSPVESTNEH